MSKEFDKWYDEYSYWAEIDEEGLPYKICKDAWEASCNEKIKQLEVENKKLKATMRLHAGDCCSLNNEVELFRGHWEDAEDENKRLNKIIEDIEDWATVSFDESLLKLIKALKAGECRK